MKDIRSRDNPFFKQLKRLAQQSRERRKQGLVLLDGVHLVAAYEGAFGQVSTLIVSEHGLTRPEIAQFVTGREVIVLADSLFRDLGIVDQPSGLLAVADAPAAGPVPDHEIDTLVLDGVQDPGNVGTLLRSAAAAGFRQAVLSGDCADAWSPKVLRAGQGAQFVLRVFEGVDLPEFLAAYAGTVAVTCLEGAQSLYDADWQAPVAWVFGSEGQGVRPAVLAAANLRIRIPMPGAMESLNVGAAAAVCLFETVRRRLGADSP